MTDATPPNDDDANTPAPGAASVPFGAWIAIFIGVGVALGVALDNLALGIGIGVALGTGIGAAITARSTRRKGPSGSNESSDD